jgi:hypothetical protein
MAIGTKGGSGYIACRTGEVKMKVALVLMAVIALGTVRPGFGAVENASPDEPFIVPAGCSQFMCARQGETYRVLSCPNLAMKSFSLPAGN